MRASRTAIVAAGLFAGVTAACDALLSIHELDATEPGDAGGQESGSDATSSADATSSEASEAGGDAAGLAEGATDAPVWAVSFGTPACAQCAQANCNAQAIACNQDPACAPYESCLGNCNGDPACRSQCTIDGGNGSGNVSALSACLASTCEIPCSVACGGFAGYLSEPGAAANCQACILSYPGVCSDSRACGSSVDCDAYWRCYMACPTPDCKFACAVEHEAGVAIFRPLQADYSGACSSACAFGNYWACVGKISWPAAKSNTVAFTVPVVDFLQIVPVPGETVTLCRSCPCNTAVDPILATGTTDDAGMVTLQLNQSTLIGPTGTGLTGCVEVTSPTGATVPYYGFWGYPLSESVVNPALGPGSPGANIASQSAQVFTPVELDGATQWIHEAPLPGRGMIGASVFDCLDNRSTGARVAINSADPAVSMYYGPNDAGATTSNGTGFFFNVQPGSYVVTAMPEGLDGAPSSLVNVYVDQNTTTAVGMFPTPPGQPPPTP